MQPVNLCLHYVDEGASRRRSTIDVEALRALLREHLSRGPVMSLTRYADRAPRSLGAFSVSFDDAHRSVLTHAAPLLSELDVPATLFVPTAYVGTSDAFLDWDELRRLQALGWTLGSHARTHERMSWRHPGESDEDHLARLVSELRASRDVMARELGAPPRLLAYPYGDAPPIAREAARRAGFDAAFVVGEGREGDPFAIGRHDPLVPAPMSDEPTPFSVIVPACDRPSLVADVVRRLVFEQSYPRDRYEVILVDDGSQEPLSSLFDTVPPHLQIVRQGDRSFRAGQARQRGVDESSRSHLLFLDADVAAPPDLLWHHDWVHRREPDTVLLGYLSGYNLHDLGRIHAPSEVIGASLSALPIIHDRSREPTLRRCLDNLDWLEDPWPLTYTGHLSVPRSLFERAGGFAADFVGWGLEDVDLGVRLHRAGASFVFSRFAVGFHVVDPEESQSRNPFRLEAPTLEDFRGYLTNLTRLQRRHPEDEAVRAYVARSQADIDETCGGPHTVGIEFGGAASRRTPHHRRLHAVQPGGVTRDELFDRLSYAHKVGARSLYLLGGAPAEHDAFLDLLRAANVDWIAVESPGYPFARPGLAQEARDAGLREVVMLVHATRRTACEDLFGEGAFEAWQAGIDALRATDMELSAHLIVTPTANLSHAVHDLEAMGIPLREVRCVRAADVERARRATGLEPSVLSLP